jgi:P4 family phage/plasmid primase-like protien
MESLIDAPTSISYNNDKILSSLTNKQVMKYIKKGMLGFGLEITSKWKEETEEYKKQVIMPNNWTQIFEWDMSKYNNGIALLTGMKSNLFVIDIDNIEHWNYLLEETDNNEPKTVKVKTGKGFHLYFNYNEKVSHLIGVNKCITLNGEKLDIDIKTNGGCIIAPPSKYFNKNINEYTKYTWERSLFTCKLLDVPDWLINLLHKKEIVKHFEHEDTSDMKIPRLVNMLNKDRNNNYDDWLNVGMCLYNIDKSNLELWDDWSKTNKKYKKGECLKKWNSFNEQPNISLKIGSLKHWAKIDNLNEYNKYKKELYSVYDMIMREDAGLGDLFYDKVKDCIKVTNNNGDGYVFRENSKLWECATRDDIKYMITPILETIIEQEITKTTDDKSKKKLTNVLGYVRKSYGVTNIFAKMYTALKDLDFENKLNSLIDHLPIKNNSKICLKTGQITKRKSEDLFSHECPVEYVKERTHINKFMKSIFVNEDKIKYVQKIYGYCLTGRIHERCLFIEYGNGSNGKGIINKLLEKILVLDKFYVQTTKDVFIHRNNNQSIATPHLYALMHKRVGIFSESSKTDKMNDEELKQLTGDDPIACRNLFEKIKTFTPICKLIIQTNNKLEFDIHDQASIDRYRYIYFDQRFVNIPKHKNEHKADQQFVDSLKKEYLNECFSYFVDGAIEWYKSNLEIPECVRNETCDYMKDLDILDNFINNKVINQEKSKIKCTDMYKHFVVYCMDHDDQMKVIKKPEFKNILHDKYNLESYMYNNIEHYKNVQVTEYNI